MIPVQVIVRSFIIACYNAWQCINNCCFWNWIVFCTFMFGSHLLPNQFLSFGFFCQSSLSVRFVVDFRHSSEVAARAIVRNIHSKCSLSWATPLSTLAVHSCHHFSRWKSQRSTSASNYCKQHSEVKITTGTAWGRRVCILHVRYLYNTPVYVHIVYFIVYCMYRVYIPVCMCIQYTPVLFCLYVYVQYLERLSQELEFLPLQNLP